MSQIRALKRFLPGRTHWLSGAIILSSCVVAYGVPNLFTAGETVNAEQMNQNFANLETRVAELEAKLASVSVETVNGQPTVRFTGVNLQLVNGQGSTESVNGVGNIMVGYDEGRSGNGFCSDGSYTTQADCETAGELWNGNQKTGSHNVIVGAGAGYTRYGGIVSGMNNAVNAPGASAVGGFANIVSGSYGAIAGGYYDKASGIYSVVVGGQTNSATGHGAVVAGGYTNTASGAESTVTGGYKNTASGSYSSVSGGSTRTASGTNNWAAGGLSQAQ